MQSIGILQYDDTVGAGSKSAILSDFGQVWNLPLLQL